MLMRFRFRPSGRKIHSFVEAVRVQQRLLQKSFKSPWVVVSMYTRLFSRYWYKVPVEFSKYHHHIIYNHASDHPRVHLGTALELIFIFLYGILSCGYVLLRKMLSPEDHPIYGHLNWIQLALCFAGLIGGSAILAVAVVLKSAGEELVAWFNALVDFKYRIQIAPMTNLTAAWSAYHKRKVIYAIYANTILQGFILVIPPLCFCLVVFNCDPTRFVIADVFSLLFPSQYRVSPFLAVLIAILRFIINTFGGLLLGGRFLSFVLLLDCCRIWTYDYCITAMTTITCPFSMHKVYSQLRLCHNVIASFYDQIYCIFIAFSQTFIVLCWWVSIVSLGKVPVILWLMFPIMAAELAVGAFLYLRMAQHVHEMSGYLLLRPLRLQSKKKVTLCYDSSGIQ